MINKAVGMINSMIDFANKAASMVGISGIGKLNKVRMGRMDDGGLGERIHDSLTKDRAGAMANAVRERAADIHEADALKGRGGGGHAKTARKKPGANQGGGKGQIPFGRSGRGQRPDAGLGRGNQSPKTRTPRNAARNARTPRMGFGA